MYHFFFFQGSNLRFNSRVFRWLYVKQSFFPGCVLVLKNLVIHTPVWCMGTKWNSPINKLIRNLHCQPSLRFCFCLILDRFHILVFILIYFIVTFFRSPKICNFLAYSEVGGEDMEFPEGYQINDMKNLQGLIKNWNFQG